MREKDLHLPQDLINKERAKERSGQEAKELLQRTCVQFLTPTRRRTSSSWGPTSSLASVGITTHALYLCSCRQYTQFKRMSREG